MYLDSRIPDARLDPPEPKAVAKCKHCGESICEGEPIVALDGAAFHYECFLDCAAQLLIHEFGAVVGVAEESDGYDG